MAQKPPAQGSARPAAKKSAKRGSAARPKTELKRTLEPDARPARSPRARPEPRPAPKRPATGEGRPISKRPATGEGRPISKRPADGTARPAAKRPGSAEPRRTAADEGLIISKRPGAGASRPEGKRSEASPAKRSGAAPAKRENETRTTARRPAPGAPRPAAKRADAEPKPAPKRPAPRKPGNRGGSNDGERLHKLLAHAGIASRRACEELILEGRVHVNGEVVTELGTKAHPYRDEVTVDFVPIHKEAAVYLLMNKPKGYVTTVKDDEGRPTVMALLHGVTARVYPVGRLDFQSEGLLLLTNDGELAHRLTGPDFHIPKVYLVKVHRMPPPELLKEFREGFRLDGRRLKPCGIEVLDKQGNPWLKVTLTEGKNQQIRRMFAAVGHPVHKLKRIQFGPLDDPSLKPGTWRPLTAMEVAALKSL